MNVPKPARVSISDEFLPPSAQAAHTRVVKIVVQV